MLLTRLVNFIGFILAFTLLFSFSTVLVAVCTLHFFIGRLFDLPIEVINMLNEAKKAAHDIEDKRA
ncbi:MAG: hypothetical protein EBZ49_06415 [Proteobacteria bacterium]|nr:hypothetical protein [Pseudomonadota bacterium]